MQIERDCGKVRLRVNGYITPRRGKDGGQMEAEEAGEGGRRRVKEEVVLAVVMVLVVSKLRSCG